jgi:hypothetical protein
MPTQRIKWILRTVVAALAWAAWWIWSQLSPHWDVRTVLAIAIVTLVPLAAIW